MAAHKYLRVRNWDRYQHYKTGEHATTRPAWVKLYTAMLDDWEMTALSLPAQLLADRLLLVAALTGNEIRNDPKWISSATKVNVKWVPGAIKELRSIGFVEPFSLKSKSRLPLAQIREDKNRKETSLSPSAEARAPLPESVVQFRRNMRRTG